MVTVNFRCDRVPGIPDMLNGTVYQRMDDGNDGRYTTTINLKRPGAATMTAFITKLGGFYAEYFNNAFLDGAPAKTQIDSYLDFNWGTGLLTAEAADFVSVHWWGKIRAPYSEEFTFLVSADDGVRVTVDGKLVVDRWDSCCEDVSFSMNLTQYAFYDTLIEYKEHQEKAHLKFEWVSLSVPREVVPPTHVHYPERVAGAAFRLEVAPGPTIAAMSTAEGAGLTASTAGKLATLYIQSRDWDGAPMANGGDDYAVSFVGPHEGGPTGVADSGSFALTATHTSLGRYIATYVPQLAGTYTLTITALGQKISGSDWTMVAAVGEIAPTECSHSLTTTPVQLTTGITHFFTITIRDMYKNVVRTSREATTVAIVATYKDHNAWLSPIAGVADLADWQEIYGRDISGLAVFNNQSASAPSSTYTGQFTIYRAGTFSLAILVNGIPIQASPLTDQILVSPAELYAPACIVHGLSLQMVAGQASTA